MIQNRPIARPFVLAILALVLVLTSSGLRASSSEPMVRMIDPALTGSGIFGGNGDHLVALRDDLASGYLVLFFPGTGASPDDYSILLEHAAARGHHVIGLSYRNSASVNFVYCQGQGQTSCPEEVRTEILTGQDTSPLLEVDEPNSAYGRLRRLLAYLHQNHPAERWGSFLDTGQIAWDRVIVAGQSQGGGHAALSAKWHRLARAILFSATEPAPWTNGPGQTPAAAFFGIVHQSELNAAGIINSWTRLGLPGALTSIDTLASPYNDARRLVTDRMDCGGDPASNGFFHNCTSADDWLPAPAADGRPAMAALWDYLFTLHPGGVDGPIVTAGPMGQSGLSYIDPEVLPGESLLTYQDAEGAIQLASLRPIDGRFEVADGREWTLDTGAWPVAETFNGPEFGLDSEGWSVFYTKQNAGIPSLWRARLGPSGPIAEPLTEGSRRQTVLASRDPGADRVRLLFLRGSLGTGQVAWMDEAAPETETVFDFYDVQLRWIDGQRRFVHIPQAGANAGELVLIDTVSSEARLITDDGDPKAFPYGYVDTASGRLKVLALIEGATAIGLWEDQGDGGLFALRTTWSLSDQNGRTIGSPEPFVVGNEAWVSFIVREGVSGGPSEVWLARSDGSAAHRCDDGEIGLARSDPESRVSDGQVAVYYNVITPAGYRLYRCVSRHPDLGDRLFSTSFEAG
jgi:hypothetical protein